MQADYVVHSIRLVVERKSCARVQRIKSKKHHLHFSGALTFPGAFHLGADIHEKAYARAADNVRFVQTEQKGKCKKGLAVDVAAWDVTAVPLRDGCVDVVVTDLVSVRS